MLKAELEAWNTEVYLLEVGDQGGIGGKVEPVRAEGVEGWGASRGPWVCDNARVKADLEGWGTPGGAEGILDHREAEGATG